MMLTRRTFVALAAAVVGTLAGTALFTSTRRGAPRGREVSRRAPILHSGETSPAGAGELGAAHVLMLRALAACFTGVPAEPDDGFSETPFDRYFQHRARRDGAYRLKIESMLNRLAFVSRGQHDREFVACDSKACLAVIAAAFAPGAEMEAFREEIQRPILVVYTRTYAWIDMGYSGWPGQPRGLEWYQQAPVTRAQTAETG